MLGLALYNNSINDKKVEWLINPLYGFGSKKMVGSRFFSLTKYNGSSYGSTIQ